MSTSVIGLATRSRTAVDPMCSTASTSAPSAALDALSVELRTHGFAVSRADGDELEVGDAAAEDVGAVAHAASIPVHRIAEVEQSLEHAYLALTSDSVEYHGRQLNAAATTTETSR